jgi:hypothetical protein
LTLDFLDSRVAEQDFLEIMRRVPGFFIFHYQKKEEDKMENNVRMKSMPKGGFKNLFQYVLLALIILSLLSLFCCGGGGGGDNGIVITDTGAQKNIGPAGGTVEVTNQNSPIYGVKLEIPAGALSSNVDISIAISDVQPTLPNSNFKRLTTMNQTIKLSPSGLKFNTPIIVTLPYDKSINEISEVVVAALYDENTGEWDIPTLLSIDTVKKQLVIKTSHFSLVDKVKAYFSISIETFPSFDFHNDKFSIQNNSADLRGTKYENTGACEGFVTYAKWYFEEKRSTAFLKDAYEISTAKYVVSDAADIHNTFGAAIIETLTALTSDLGVRDYWTAGLLITALVFTRHPQVLGLTTSPILPWGDWHAVLAYKWNFSEKSFYIYNPNNNSMHDKIYFDTFFSDFTPLNDQKTYKGFLYLGVKTLFDNDEMQDIYDKYKSYMGYTLQYSHDFSSDPGWTTNNASRFYRDPATNTFFATTVEGAEEYATIPVNWTGNSFRIEFDIKIASSQFASGISVGLFDADRHDSLPNVVDVVYGNSSAGLHVNLHAANSTASKYTPSTVQNVQTNVWYHNIITWEEDTGIVKLELTNRDTGAAIGTYTIDGFASFPTDMHNLGISWVGHNASSNRTTSYIDNVKFYEK